jgi:hypothetical protein
MAVALWGDRQVASVTSGGTDRGIGYMVRGVAQQGRKGYPEPLVARVLETWGHF